MKVPKPVAREQRLVRADLCRVNRSEVVVVTNGSTDYTPAHPCACNRTWYVRSRIAFATGRSAWPTGDSAVDLRKGEGGGVRDVRSWCSDDQDARGDGAEVGAEVHW